METTLYNSYIFKAMDAYPYNLEETIEALNYALSYDKNNVQALCLMAKFSAEQLGDYETAKSYFAEALAQKMENPVLYPDYIRVLIQNEDYLEAQKLLDFALSIKGTDKAGLQIIQGQLLEVLMKWKEAKKAYKKALKMGCNSAFISFVEEEIKRVKQKLPHKKAKAKSKNKNKKKSVK
tara:strand:+ start:53647 stop:54183 length:537 start_codon:yes stop_codon:yes gene_type:complete